VVLGYGAMLATKIGKKMVIRKLCPTLNEANKQGAAPWRNPLL
jgi:hypothetical protein